MPADAGANRLAYGFAILGLALALVAPQMVGLSVDASGGLKIATIVVAFLCVRLVADKLKMPALKVGSECIAILVFMVPIILILSYCGMKLNLPLADASLAKADAAMGFDAAKFITFVDQSRIASKILEFAYDSFWVQLLVVPVLLAAANQMKCAYESVSTFALICLISCGTGLFFPSVASYRYFDLAQADLINISMALAEHYQASFYLVRNDPAYVLTMTSASGIITFPSVHAATAVLLAHASRSLRGFWIPLMILNGLMMISAITHGAHYLVDLIGGTLIAVFSIWAVKQLQAKLAALPTFPRLTRPAAPAALTAAH